MARVYTVKTPKIPQAKDNKQQKNSNREMIQDKENEKKSE